jgi:hypothetical protein
MTRHRATKIYPASKSRHWPFWTALRAAGVPIAASYAIAAIKVAS